MTSSVTKQEMTCTHVNVTVVGEGAFQYCEDCGAVRSRIANRVGSYGEWHVCALCRLPSMSEVSDD